MEILTENLYFIMQMDKNVVLHELLRLIIGFLLQLQNSGKLVQRNYSTDGVNKIKIVVFLPLS